MKKVAILTSAIALLLAACTNEEKQDLPNIIFILADDMGYADLSSYGAEKIHTPNMDRLAECSLQRLITAPVCSPSRAG